MDLHGAVSHARRMEIPEGKYQPTADAEDRNKLLARWHDHDLYDYVVHLAAEKMEKMVAAYNAESFPL
jgi:hypothetical protein